MGELPKVVWSDAELKILKPLEGTELAIDMAKSKLSFIERELEALHIHTQLARALLETIEGDKDARENEPKAKP